MKKYSPEMLVFSCAQPGLLYYYTNLGCFSYTKNIIQEEYPILQIPFCYLICDTEYQRQRKIVVYHRTLHAIHALKDRQDEVSKILSKDYLSILPHNQFHATPSELALYRKNIHSEKNKKHYDFIVSTLKQIITIETPPGVTIVTKDIVDYDFYILLEGKLGVFENDKLIGQFDPGCIFGEMAMFHEENKRSNDVKSLTPVKIMIIPRNTLRHLEHKDPATANKLLRMLSICISEKLRGANEIIVGLDNKIEKNDYNTYSNDISFNKDSAIKKTI